MFVQADDARNGFEETATAFKVSKLAIKLENKALVRKSTNQIQENMARSL